MYIFCVYLLSLSFQIIAAQAKAIIV